MDPQLFQRDIERTPETLRSLAITIGDRNPWRDLLSAGDQSGRKIVLLGMGSSHFANSVLALRLQAHGIWAFATLASTDPLPAVKENDLVIAVSAGGFSAETVSAITKFSGKCQTIAVTNTSGSLIEQACDSHISMMAEIEEGGVACRSFAHTLALHFALLEVLTGSPRASEIVTLAAESTQDLLDSREQWLAPLSEILLGPDGTTIVAPSRRLASAQQSALMLREGPRLPAIACETGDWSHIDVYLTKTTDYRMLVFPGSDWEGQLLGWCSQRGSTVAVVGGELPSTSMTLRYVNDSNDDVRLLTEALVIECIAAEKWTNQTSE
ncbi:MAG: SIS domain-containing protein [Candidatus Nanopelagicales bacterium]